MKRAIVFLTFAVFIAFNNAAAQEQFDVNMQKGIARLNNYKPKEAILEFTKVISMTPSLKPGLLLYKAYLNRGKAYEMTYDFENALKDYNNAIFLNDHDAGVYVLRGKIYTQKRYYDIAVADFNKAISIQKNIPQVYEYRAGIFYIKGEYEKAMVDIKKAESLGLKVDEELVDLIRTRRKPEKAFPESSMEVKKQIKDVVNEFLDFMVIRVNKEDKASQIYDVYRTFKLLKIFDLTRENQYVKAITKMEKVMDEGSFQTVGPKSNNLPEVTFLLMMIMELQDSLILMAGELERENYSIGEIELSHDLKEAIVEIKDNNMNIVLITVRLRTKDDIWKLYKIGVR